MTLNDLFALAKAARDRTGQYWSVTLDFGAHWGSKWNPPSDRLELTVYDGETSHVCRTAEEAAAILRGDSNAAGLADVDLSGLVNDGEVS